MKKALLTFSFLLLFLNAHSIICRNEIDILKDNYKSLFLHLKSDNNKILNDFIKIEPENQVSDQMVQELHQLYPLDIKVIENFIVSQNADGSWSDINYEDTKRSGWEPNNHAQRILALAKAYNDTKSLYYHSQKLENTLHKALNFWFDAKLRCPNWWYNEIGVPRTLGVAFILMEDKLLDSEKSKAIEIMENSRFGMTGQNKVWLAGNVLVKALLQNDNALVKAARDTIASEIVLGRREGIKSDWSFHQHGPQQQFGNYGLAFISGMTFYYRLFNGTSLEFDKTHKDILESFINNGYRWIIWNRYMDVCSLDRQLFHNSQIHKAYNIAFAAQNMGIKIFDAKPLVGHKHFYDSDYTIHRTGKWMASVKMSSSRVIGSELVNEDNLKGYYMGDGATYFYSRGDEYFNVFPFWDWRKVPGVTTYSNDGRPMPTLKKGSLPRNATKNVGGLTIGNMGLSVMQLNRDGLHANKAWLINDDYIVCIGGDIYSDSTLAVTTSVEQKLRKGDAYAYINDTWTKMDGNKMFDAKGVKRFIHDGFGYIVADKGDECSLILEKRNGSWSDFMKMYKPCRISGDIMELYINHGVSPKSSSYLYVVMPDADKEKVAEFDMRSIKMLRNDSKMQIVACVEKEHHYWVVAYDKADLKLNKARMTINNPGIYYVNVVKDKAVIEGKTEF